MVAMANKNSDKKTIENENGEVVDYDQLLSSAGEFGRYQLFLFCTTFPFYVFASFTYFGQMFLTETSPNHWCFIPELQNLTVEERRNLAIPSDANSPFKYSRCKAYDANWSEVLSTGVTPNQTWNTIPCQHGWEYNKTEFPYPTIASEMGWVCERDSYQATAQSMFFVGSIFGGFLIGFVADRYGRLPAAVVSNMFGAIAGLASVFVTSFIPFVVCRFFVGMAYDNCMMMTYILVLEYVVPKHRTMMANLSFGIFFTIGAISLPWIALACGHWKTLGLVVSLPMFLSLLAPFIIPESPRWLLSKGRVDDAVSKVLTIARKNKKEVPQDLIDKFKTTLSNTKEVHGNVLDLVKRPIMRRMFICACIEYMTSILIFDALVRTIGQLQFDFFISFAVISLTELPSLILLSFVLDITGRKSMVIVTLIVCSVACFVTPFVDAGIPAVICAVIARFAMNMACNTCIQWSAEMIPASVRGSGTSIVHTSGYIATVLAPFVAYLETYKPWLPMIVVASIAIFSALIALTLPETAQKDLPQTMEESENMVKSQGVFDFPFLNKKSI